MVSFFGNIFRQIIPLSIRHTPMPGTILFLQAPRVHTSGVSGPQPQAFARAEEAVLGAPFNTQSQAPDSGGGCPGHFFQHPVPGAKRRQTFRVLRRALLFRNTQFPYRPNPRPRIYTLCTHLRKSFWLPSTHKIQRPSQSLGHSFAVAARVYGRALGFFQRTRSSS